MADFTERCPDPFFVLAPAELIGQANVMRYSLKSFHSSWNCKLDFTEIRCLDTFILGSMICRSRL